MNTTSLRFAKPFVRRRLTHEQLKLMKDFRRNLSELIESFLLRTAAFYQSVSKFE